MPSRTVVSELQTAHRAAVQQLGQRMMMGGGMMAPQANLGKLLSDHLELLAGVLTENLARVKGGK